MASLVVELDDLRSMTGVDLGRTDYRLLTQRHIDEFADVTDDHQWIHEAGDTSLSGPFGGPIAHGFLTLALLTPLSQQLLRVEGVRSRVNYGLDRVRFISPVPAGSQVRLHAVIDDVVELEGGLQVTTVTELELESATRPALAARFIVRYLR